MSSVAVTVIVAVPLATAVTTPPSTVAIVSSLEDHSTVCTYALEGATVAVNVSVASGANVTSLLFKVTPVTPTFSTLIRALALTAQLVAVIEISSHSATGVTKPFSLTVALLLFQEVQVTGNSLEVGVTVAVNCKVTNGCASLTVQVVGLTAILSGCISLSLPDWARISSSYSSTSQGV